MEISRERREVAESLKLTSEQVAVPLKPKRKQYAYIPRDQHFNPLECSSQSIMESNVEFCRKAYQQKSNSAHNAKVAVNMNRLAKSGVHWEFGKEIDFSNERDCRNYLVYLMDWLEKIKLPTEIVLFKQFVHREKKAHRIIAWRLLALAGCRRAKLFMLVIQNRLTQEKLNKSIVEAQGSNNVGAVIGTTAYTMLYILSAIFYWPWKGVSYATDKMMEALKGLKLPSAKEVATNIGEKLKMIGTSAAEAAKVMYKWIKETVESMLGYFTDLVGWLYWFTSTFFYLIVSVVGIFIIFSLVPALAIAATRYLVAKLGLNDADPMIEVLKKKAEEVKKSDEVTAQGGAYYDMMKPMSTFLATNMGMSYAFFSETMGTLPKIHSVGKAVEFFLDKGFIICRSCVEWWTGKPMPHGQIEQEIVEFCDEVHAFKMRMLSGDVKISLSPETEALMIKLDAMKVRIERNMNIVNVRKPVRTYFSSRMNVTVSQYNQTRIEYVNLRRSANPRPVPVWVYITGSPGVGKSKITTQLMVDVWDQIRSRRPLMVPSRPWNYSDVYTLNQSEQFFDNYGKQFFCIIDDLFQSVDPESRRNTALSLISMVASVPYSLRVATPEQKGNSFFESRCIISTTNVLTEKLDGKSLGLESTEALESRRTIMVRMYEDSTFRLYPYCQITIDGEQKEFLQYEELVALIVECLIRRDDQIKVLNQPTKIPAVNIEYVGGRIDICPRPIGAPAQPGVQLSSRTGKEKVKGDSIEAQMMEGDADEGPSDPHVVNEDPSDLHVTRGPIDDDDVVSATDTFESRRDAAFDAMREWTQRPSTINRFRRLEDDVDGTLTLSWETNAWDNQPNWRRSELWCGGDEKFMVGDCPIEQLMDDDAPGMVELLAREVLEKPLFSTFSTRPIPLMYTAVQARVYPYYLGDGVFTTCRSPEEWKWFKECYEQKEEVKFVDGKYRYKIHAEDEDYTPALFRWMPSFITKRLITQHPHWFMPRYTRKSVPFFGPRGEEPTWESIFATWLLQLGKTNHEKKFYSKMLKDWDVSGWTETEFRTFFNNVHTNRVTMSNIALGLAVMGVAFAAVAIAFKHLSPGVVYREAQHYPGGGIRDNKVRIVRTAGRQVRRLADLKARDAKAASKAQMKNREDAYIYKLIERNTEIIETKVTVKGVAPEIVNATEPLCSSYCLFVSGRRALVPMHVMLALGVQDDEHDRWISLVRGQNYTVNIKDLTMIEEIRGDVAIVEFPGIPEKPTIIQHFASSFPTHGVVDHIRPFPDASSFHVRTTPMYENKIETVHIGNDYEPFMTDVVLHDIPNYGGLCGTVYCTNKGQQIFAVHMAGNKHTQTAYAVTIFKEDLEKYATRFGNIVQPVTFDMRPAAQARGIQVLGYSDSKYGVYQATETNLRKSQFMMEHFPFPKTDSQPAMLKKMGDVDPLKNAFDKIGKQYYPGKPQRVDTDLMGFLPPSFNKNNLRPLTLEETIYGIPGVISALDVKTSSGWYYKKMGLDRQHLFYDENGNRRIHPVLKRNIKTKRKRVIAGEVIVPVYEDTLKDELRDAERVAAGKTRLFTSGDLDFLILQKMFLGMMIVEMEKDPVNSPCGLGLNPHSKDWGQLYARLKGEESWEVQILCGDFGGFDISVKNESRDDFVKLAETVTKDRPYPPGVVGSLIVGSFLGWHVCGTLWFLRPWGTNSGSFITSLFNTFVNWREHKEAFLKIYPRGDFKQIPCSFTGDDSILSVRKDYRQYNMAYLSRFFRDQYGMDYTSCFKDYRTELPLDEVQYLKRRFLPGEMGIMAPLDPRSMYDMVSWTNKDPSRQILQSTIDSLMLESFHYGREIYMEVYDWVNQQTWMGGNYSALTYDDMRALREPDYWGIQAQSSRHSLINLLSMRLNCRSPQPGWVANGHAQLNDPQRHWVNCQRPRDWLLPSASLNITTETTRQAHESIQSDATQTMTSTAETALYQTPTLSYGEVGETHMVQVDGVPYQAQGVGKFESTKLLERMALLYDLNWTTTSSSTLASPNILSNLANLARNAPILQQFGYMRAGVEVTVRLNTTQFYYGALMAVLYPTTSTGQRTDERAVLDPTIISANSANAIIKKWNFQFPHAWWKTSDVVAGTHSVNLGLDVVAPLNVASANAADTVAVQIWARFTDVVLAYPTGTLAEKRKGIEAQSASGKVPKVKIPRKGSTPHPVDDTDEFGVVLDALRSVAAPDDSQKSESFVNQLISWAPLAIGAAALFLDKPDKSDSQMATIQEPGIDMFNCDIEDTNVNIGLYKQKYVDPSPARMPMGKTLTVSDYARIPGLRQAAIAFTTTGQTATVNLIQTHPDGTTYKVPLDWAFVSSRMWRGSVKVMLQFFTSSFISARFAVQLVNANEVSTLPTDYTSGISRVVDVKGDTVDTFLFPYLNSSWWSQSADPQITLTVVSDIVSTDTTVSPKIYCLVWVAGGEDIQFAFPRVPLPTDWADTAPDKKGRIEAQCSIGKMFESTFPPVGENVQFETDTGLATGEVLGPITDICKRYSPLIAHASSPAAAQGVPAYVLDLDPFTVGIGSVAYADYWRFRQTLYGCWRSAFLFQSGGYRYRVYQTEKTTFNFFQNNQPVSGTYYLTPPDYTTRVTVPQLSLMPFRYLTGTFTSDPFRMIGISPNTALGLDDLEYLAARDDIQFGFPILPRALPNPTLLSDKKGDPIRKKFDQSEFAKGDDRSAVNSSRRLNASQH